MLSNAFSRDIVKPVAVKKIIYTITLDGGVVVNLPEKSTSSSGIKHIASANGFIGLQTGMFYRGLNITIGFYHYSYAAGAKYIDEGVTTGEKFFFAGDNTAYTRIPFTLGYSFNTRNKKITVVPYITAGSLYTANSNILFSTHAGLMMATAKDTITSDSYLAMERLYKSLLFTGIGCKLSYQYKKILFAVHAEYSQCSKVWTFIRATYNRTSNLAGDYHDENVFNSKAKSVIAGFSVGISF